MALQNTTTNKTSPPDSRPPIDHKLRDWLSNITGYNIAPLAPGVHPPNPDADLSYGDLGDHRWEELTTLTDYSNVLFPARLGLLDSIERDLYSLKGAKPRGLEVTTASNNQALKQQALQDLANGQPSHLLQDVDEIFVDMRLNPGNVSATTLCGAEEDVSVAGGLSQLVRATQCLPVSQDGQWTQMKLSPDWKPKRWEQFLALGFHPGAGIDDVARGQKDATGRVVMSTSETKAWGERYICFQPFASRMHATKACEFRYQGFGHCLIYILTWKDPEKATPDARKYREEAWMDRDFINCIWAGKESKRQGEWPVSQLYQVTTSPGSLILIPPGALVIEYSSGASASMEGDFLPWACTPQLRLGHGVIPPFILKSMLLRATADVESGRANKAQVVALAEVVNGTPIQLPRTYISYQQGVDAMEADVKEVMKAIQKL
ncbi:hypothetical protein FRC00_003672 [Tulasnella sp. 408]|nr:hypothetical protein FRC00_003672 [Tulasnella sp. 408]